MILLCRLLVWAVTAACLTPVLLYSAEQDTSMPATSPDKNGLIVNAPAGTVEGRMEGELRVCKGIPYALPPVGSARWRPPCPMLQWTGVRKATKFGSACFQLGDGNAERPAQRRCIRSQRSPQPAPSVPARAGAAIQAGNEV